MGDNDDDRKYYDYHDDVVVFQADACLAQVQSPLLIHGDDDYFDAVYDYCDDFDYDELHDHVGDYRDDELPPFLEIFI